MAVSEANQLLATQIAYADLDGAYDALTRKGQPATLENALLWAQEKDIAMAHFEKYLNADGTLQDEYAYANTWTITAVVNDNATGGTGLYACILDTGTDNILACRGSEDMTKLDNLEQDWIGADLGLLNATMTAQEEALKTFINDGDGAVLTDQPWVATGHSLGGALADYAAVLSVSQGWENFSGAINFDGPGHSNEFVSQYANDIAAIADSMTHKKASIVGEIFGSMPGVTVEYIKVASESQFTTADGSPYPQVTDSATFQCHDTQNWEREEDGSLAVGSQGALEYFVEKFTKGADNLPSFVGDIVIAIASNLIDVAQWANDHETLAAFLAGIATGIATLVVETVGVGTVILSVVAAVVCVLAAILGVTLAQILAEFVAYIANAIVEAVVAAIEAMKDLAKQLYQALVDAFDSIKEFIRNQSAGVKYAADNPYFKVDTAKLESYATRLIMVNSRLTDLDTDLRGLYWQVGFTDIWDILTANLIVGGSSTLNKIKSYLNDAADDFAQAEQKASQYMGG